MESKASLGCLNKPMLDSLGAGRFLFIGGIQLATSILARHPHSKALRNSQFKITPSPMKCSLSRSPELCCREDLEAGFTAACKTETSCGVT